MRRVLLIALLSSACAPGEPPPPPPVTPAGTVELGVMGEDFVALQDGTEVELIPGAQGGFHVAILLRVGGFDASSMVEVERDTRRDDTRELVASTSFRSAIGEGGVLVREVPVFLCPAPVGISIADEPLEVSVKVSSDAIGEASLAFVPRCPIGDEADFCDRICRR